MRERRPRYSPKSLFSGLPVQPFANWKVVEPQQQIGQEDVSGHHADRKPGAGVERVGLVAYHPHVERYGLLSQKTIKKDKNVVSGYYIVIIIVLLKPLDSIDSSILLIYETYSSAFLSMSDRRTNEGR